MKVRTTRHCGTYSIGIIYYYTLHDFDRCGKTIIIIITRIVRTKRETIIFLAQLTVIGASIVSIIINTTAAEVQQQRDRLNRNIYIYNKLLKSKTNVYRNT